MIFIAILNRENIGKNRVFHDYIDKNVKMTILTI